MAGEVFPGLHALRDGSACGQFHHTGTKETQQRAGFCEREMPGRSPGSQNSAGGGVAQVYKERQVFVFVAVYSGGDGDHHGECWAAFLHACPARRGGDKQGKAKLGGAVNACDDAARGGSADGTAKKGKFAENEGNSNAAYGAFTGDNCLVNAGFFACSGEIGLVAG